MEFFLLKMKINGIKDIDREVEIKFCNSVLKRKFDPSDSHVKAIYGANGAGKTALVYAVEVYRSLMCKSGYLTFCNATGSLSGYLNDRLKALTVEMTFAQIGNNSEIAAIYSHFVRLEKRGEEIFLGEEKLSRLTGLNLNAQEKYVTVYHIRNGEIVALAQGCKNAEAFRSATANLLDLQPFPLAILKDLSLINSDAEITAGLAAVLNFTFVQLTVVIQDSDASPIFDLDLISNQIKAMERARLKLNDDTLFYRMLSTKAIPWNNPKTIAIDLYGEYEKQVNRLCRFVQVFQSELERIDIERETANDAYECQLVFVYKNGARVGEKYESTGVKKLSRLYSALCDLEEGKIVFIDEFDANIHDVLFAKLIEYACEYAAGQLIFTTHNLAPMDILQKKKHGIDFLSVGSRVTSWVRNGNYSAASLYRKGFIENSPFNLEAFHFLGVFGEEKRGKKGEGE